MLLFFLFFFEKREFTQYFDINEADFNKYIRNLALNNEIVALLL